jgi:hypothetical protein
MSHEASVCVYVYVSTRVSLVVSANACQSMDGGPPVSMQTVRTCILARMSGHVIAIHGGNRRQN